MKIQSIAVLALLALTTTPSFAAPINDAHSACERQRESMRLIAHSAQLETILQKMLLILCNGDESENCAWVRENSEGVIVKASQIEVSANEMLKAPVKDECSVGMDEWINEKSRLARTLAGPSVDGIRAAFRVVQ